MFEYQARLVEIVDGDTIDVTVDLGFGIQHNIRLRLRNIDTAEIHGVDHDSEEYELGMKHKEYVVDWFDSAERSYNGEWPFKVKTQKKGKFGRYLAKVERKEDEAILQNDLLDEFDNIRYN